ncbi:type II secretion system F family protein [Patescibacteria group bacterium]|nr:type II secretion system F family protein [Patescibacteria group bacterium]
MNFCFALCALSFEFIFMRYKYKARTREGKIRKGIIESSTRKDALSLLEKYGFYTTSLKIAGKEGLLATKLSFKRISLSDVTIFTRQLAVMLKSAISPTEALASLVIQAENSDFREKILKMGELIERGRSLSQAFSMFPETFDPFFVSVIKSGEVSGKVADSLNYLAAHLERKGKLNERVKGAMVYPIFIVVVFIAVFFLTAFFIVPNLTQLLANFKGKLPLFTRIIISLSEFTKKGGWIIIVGILGFLFFLFLYFKKSLAAKKYYDKYILRLPIIGDLTKKIYLARFSENLSVLLKAGLPITQALKISQDIIENLTYKKIIAEAEQEVMRGENISSVFSKYPREVPAFVSQMILTGEKTGTLDQTLMEVINFYQEEIDRTTMNLSAIIEPVLLLVLGAGIAVLAIAIFIPLFQIGLGSANM